MPINYSEKLVRLSGLVLLATLLAACQTTPTTTPRGKLFSPSPAVPDLPKRVGYTCCNLHYEGDWISDANWSALPFIPAGTPIKLTGTGRYRLNVEIAGKPLRIGLDYGRERLSLARFAEQIIVTNDPRATLAKWPPAIQQAIAAGKAMLGMTKEQAIMALGYPQSDQTRSLDAPVWNYWASSFGQYMLFWDKRGTLIRVESDPSTYDKVVAKPR